MTKIYALGLCDPLLIEDGNRLILIDNGIGDKQDDKFLRHYYLHGDVSLENSLKSTDLHQMILQMYF